MRSWEAGYPRAVMPNEGIELDPNTAKRAWEETAPLRAALEPVGLPRVDLGDVAILAIGIANVLREPEVRRRFGLLHPELFDPELLDRFELAAWALWFGHNQRLTAEAIEDDATLSASTLSRALEIEKRMMRVVEYVLGDDPDAGPVVAAIRAGTGHIDLAADLTSLATLYEEHRAVLEAGGGAHYRASDERDAKAAAARIVFELGGRDRSAAEAKDQAARAFALLERTYERIRGFAHLIIENGRERFPSLWSVRASPRSRK